MARFKNRNLHCMLVAVAVSSASLLGVADTADAAGALFRAQQTWWFSTTNAQEWTDGQVWPTSGTMKHSVYLPPETAYVGPTMGNPKFTIPYAFIKNTTYTFMCAATGTFMCYIGYPNSSGFYSYWNQEGHFRPSNAYAPTTTTTIRKRTISDDRTANGGWATQMVVFGKGKNERTVTLPTHPPTAMYTLTTPTEGGCHVGGTFGGTTINAKNQCPGTTQYNGRYAASRGGSIMIFPGTNRFGGTMRWFDGPNNFFYQLITISGPFTAVSFPATPISKQIQGDVELTLNQLTASPGAVRYRLTDQFHTQRLITDGSTSANCPTRPPVNPPNHGTACAYYVKYVRYIQTRAPYTTAKVQQWQPNGNTNTVQTTTGYDNRTTMGLSGNISLVRPMLVHSYVTLPSAQDTGGITPTILVWSSARLKKMDYRFLPEPAGIAMLAVGFTTLAGLYRLRKR